MTISLKDWVYFNTHRLGIGRQPELTLTRRKSFLRIEYGIDFRAEIEDTFYAYQYQPSETQGTYNDQFSYFGIYTKLIAEDLGQNKIRQVHYRLEFEPVDKEKDPPVEIQAHAPRDIKIDVGTTVKKVTINTDMGGNIKGTLNAGFGGGLGLQGQLSAGKQYNRRIEAVSSYPTEIWLVLSGGVANVAKWDFQQGDEAGRTGQYDELYVWFRLKKPIGQINEGTGSYRVIPEIKINGLDLDRDRHGKKIPELVSLPLYFIKI